jgi:hypothetical protein
MRCGTCDECREGIQCRDFPEMVQDEPSPVPCAGCETTEGVALHNIEVTIPGVVSTFVNVIGLCVPSKALAGKAEWPSVFMTRREIDRWHRQRESLCAKLRSVMRQQIQAI